MAALDPRAKAAAAAALQQFTTIRDERLVPEI